MAIQSQISRITEDRNTIRTKLVALGLATTTDNLDTLATAVQSITDRGTPEAEVQEGETYTILPGYYHGGTVTGVAGGGHYTLQAKSGIVPSKSQQTITADSGYYGLSSVQISPIPNQYQDVSSVTANVADVLATKTIVTATGELVAGTMTNNGAITRVLTVDTNLIYIPAGYHNGNGTVSYTPEQKTVTPTETAITVQPSSNKLLTQVIVNPIPNNYVDTSDASIDATEVLSGQIAYGYNETLGKALRIQGTMANNGAVTGTITGLGAIQGDTYFDIPDGYTSGGRISLTTDIETALAAV